MKSHRQIFIHLVWATYKRKEMIDDNYAPYIEKLSKDKIEENRCKLLAFGWTTDHVHLLVSLHPSVSISSLVSEVKGFTSFVIANKVDPGCGFRWQRGYGAFTVSNSDLERLKNYIKNQKERHDNNNSEGISEIKKVL